MTQLSVLLLDTEPCTSNGYITLAIEDALRRHPKVGRVVRAHHGNALRLFVDLGLDTFIAFGSARTHSAILERLSGLARLSILWTTEDPYERASNVAYSAWFDAVFTNDRSSVSAYGGRARHLPLAASPMFQDFGVQEREEAYRYDLLFIGTAWPNRVRSLNRIMSAFAGRLKVKLALPWNSFIGPPDLDDPTMLTDWRCGNRDFARFANRSRIVLTLPRHFSAATDDQTTGSTPPPRLFETALAGGFQLVVSPEPEVEDYYAAGTEIGLCASDDEAITAIGEMIAAPERRIRMAEAARARTLRDHLYDHRIARLLEESLAHRREPATPALETRPKTLLNVSHNRLGYGKGGGVEVYQEVLTGLEPDYEVLFLFATKIDGRHALCLEGRGLRRFYEHDEIDRTILTSPRMEQILGEVLIEYRVDLVHFHHLIHLPLSLPVIAKAFGVPTVWHLHDYYLICDRFNLIGFERRFCDVVRTGPDSCDLCLSATDHRLPGSKARRDGVMAQSVSAIDAFIGSTPSVTGYVGAFYPEIAPEKLHVIELPVLTGDTRPIQADPTTPLGASRPLNVALPGNFTREKGADYVVEIMRLCEGLDIKFHIFGRVEPYLTKRLKLMDLSRISILDGYDQQDIGALLAPCDVSLHLSIWPETYMLSLTEAWQAALVPIVTTLGAPGERVTDGVDGFRVAPDDPAAALACLHRLHFDRNLLFRLRQGIRLKQFVGVPEHLGAIRALYADLLAKRPVPEPAPQEPALRHRADLTLLDAGLRLNAPSWAWPNNIWDPQLHAPPREDGAYAVGLAPDLPLEHSALPIEIAAVGRDGVLGLIDDIRLDGRSPAGAGATPVVIRTLFIRGWLLDEASAGPAQAYLRLRSEAGIHYAALQAEARVDVEYNLQLKTGADVGFRGAIDVGALPSGRYRLEILRVAGDRMLVLDLLGEVMFHTLADYRQDRAATWRREEAGVDEVVLSQSTTIRGVDQNLPEIAGTLVGQRNALWRVTGSVNFVDEARSDLITAVLAGCDRRVRYTIRAFWRRRPLGRLNAVSRTGYFGLVSRLESLEPGSYELRLELGNGLLRQSLKTGLRIFVPSIDRLYVWINGPSPTLELGVAAVASETLSLDVIATLTEPAQGAVVQCSGWSFAAGLGAAQGTFAEWLEHGRNRRCESVTMLREDVAIHFDTSDARNCGFDLVIPEAALRRGNVRFIQRYAGGLVEFSNFEALLKKGHWM